MNTYNINEFDHVFKTMICFLHNCSHSFTKHKEWYYLILFLLSWTARLFHCSNIKIRAAFLLYFRCTNSVRLHKVWVVPCISVFLSCSSSDWINTWCQGDSPQLFLTNTEVQHYGPNESPVSLYFVRSCAPGMRYLSSCEQSKYISSCLNSAFNTFAM